MKPALLIFASLLLLAFSATSPAFFWAGNSVFKGSNMQFDKTVQPEDIRYLLRHIVEGKQTQGAYSTMLNEVPPPEIVVLYIVPEMNTEMLSTLSAAYSKKPDGGSLAHLKNAMLTSPSSIVSPYVATDGALTDSVVFKLIEEAQGDVILARSKNSDINLDQFGSLKGIDVQSIDALMNFLQIKDAPLYTNNQPDIVAVFFDEESWTSGDSILGFVDDLIKENTNGNYFSMYISNSVPKQKLNLRYIHHDFASISRQLDLGNNTRNGTLPFFTQPIIMGMFTTLVLGFGILVGTCCLSALQAPDGLQGTKQKMA